MSTKSKTLIRYRNAGGTTQEAFLIEALNHQGKKVQPKRGEWFNCYDDTGVFSITHLEFIEVVSESE